MKSRLLYSASFWGDQVSSAVLLPLFWSLLWLSKVAPRPLTRGGGTGGPWLGLGEDPGGSELADSLAAAPGVPFFPHHSSWHHTQHSPSFPAQRLLAADIDKKRRKDIFHTLEMCCPPQLCSASSQPRCQRGVQSEQHPSSAHVNRCERGCDFHQRPSKASDVNSKAKDATLEIPASSAADRSKFCGCTKRGKECHCMLSLLFCFFPFVQILCFIFFPPVITEFKEDRWVPIRIRPSFRNPSILLLSCKKELYTLVVLCHLAGITENIQQCLIGSPRV